MSCNAEFTTQDGDTLACILEPGHYGPVHSDGTSDWGDATGALLPDPDA